MKRQYNLVASSFYIKKDLRLIHWFETETKCIENLLEEYRQQCVNLARMPICVKWQKT
jgi:hypothetical protein